MGFFDNFINKVKEIDDKLAKDVSFKCSSCGATITGKSNKKSLQCQFCGNFEDNPKYKSALIDAPSKSANRPAIQPTQNFDDDFDDDDFEDDFNDFSHSNTFGRNHHSKFEKPVYAYIEKGGLFFEGEIPGITFSKVTLCKSYKECKDKLRAKFYEEKTRAFYKPPVQDIDKIEREHPRAKIIVID